MESVGEIHTLGNWGLPVHLSGYTVNLLRSQTSLSSPSVSLKEAFQRAQGETEFDVADDEGIEGDEDEDEGEDEDEDEPEEEPKKAPMQLFDEEDAAPSKQANGSLASPTKSDASPTKSDASPTKSEPEGAEGDDEDEDFEKDPEIKKVAEAAPKKKKKQKTQDTQSEKEQKPQAKPVTKVTVIKLPSGVQYQEVAIGQGQLVKDGETLSVRYKGMLQNGNVFDTNMPKGRPFRFQLGGKGVITGWNFGLRGMKVGGRRNLLIPPQHAYGSAGSPPTIPPNSPLIFEIHLIGTK